MLCGSGEKMHKGHAEKEWMSEFKDASKRNDYPRCRSHIFLRKRKQERVKGERQKEKIFPTVENIDSGHSITDMKKRNVRSEHDRNYTRQNSTATPCPSTLG